MSVLVYKYACYPDSEQTKERANRQMDLYCRYRDRLITHAMFCRNLGLQRDKAQLSADTRADRAGFTALGLWYGTYWLAEEAALQSFKKRQRDKETGKFSERGLGMDGGRLGAGIMWDNLVTCGPQGIMGPKLTFEPTDRPKQVFVSFLCSNDRTTRWRVKLHRPLPPGRVKRAVITRERISSLARLGPPVHRFEIHFTIETEVATVSAKEGLSAALDTGWWSQDDTIRCYDLVDETGHHERQLLPEPMRNKFGHADSIKSIRDDGRDGLKLRTWVRKAVEDPSLHPRRQQIAHLDVWAKGELRRVIRQRNAFYEQTARALCARYATLYIEDLNLSRMAKKKPGDGKRYQPGNRQLGAPGMFRATLIKVAAKLGTTVVLVDPAYTTQTCSLCGDTSPWEHPGQREHRCAGCGETYERPWNSARNILAFG
jgi:Putative transposase DNA-binding domain